MNPIPVPPPRVTIIALLGALMVGVVREFGIAFFPEVELAVLYFMAAVVLLIRPAGLFGHV